MNHVEKEFKEAYKNDQFIPIDYKTYDEINNVDDLRNILEHSMNTYRDGYIEYIKFSSDNSIDLTNENIKSIYRKFW